MESSKVFEIELIVTVAKLEVVRVRFVVHRALLRHGARTGRMGSGEANADVAEEEDMA